MNIEQAKKEFESKGFPVLLFSDEMELVWHNQCAEETALILPVILTDEAKRRINSRLEQFSSARLSLSDFVGMSDEMMFIKTEFGSVAIVDRSARETLSGVSYAVNGTDRISAEVRSDIEAIMLTAVALERRIDSDQPEIETGFEEVRRGAYRMLRTITNATLVSRYYSGELELSPSACDVREVVKDICDATKAVCRKRISLEVTAPEDAVYASIDIELFKRALLNLLLNSVKFEQDDALIRVSVVHSGDYITVSVKDNGKGIKEHNLGQVQQPYFSCEPADDGGAKPGLGLGITIASIFCRIHGGCVVAESEFGKGTSVSLTFKRGRADEAPELRESAAQYVTDRRSRVYVELCDISILPN